MHSDKRKENKNEKTYKSTIQSGACSFLSQYCEQADEP